MTEEVKEDRALKVLFSGEEVKVGGGTVRVTPLPLSKLSIVIESFDTLMTRAADGMNPAELATVGLRELLHIIPYCIDTDTDAIPAAELPVILEKVIEQNISDAIVGKWQALIPKVTAMFELKDQSAPSDKKLSEASSS